MLRLGSNFLYSEPRDHILHSTLKNGKGSEIKMAADTWSGTTHPPGNNFVVMIRGDDVDEAERLFNALSEGGIVCHNGASRDILGGPV
jgi:uncharacterized glyoxalase superfamily protein PhnB